MLLFIFYDAVYNGLMFCISQCCVSVFFKIGDMISEVTLHWVHFLVPRWLTVCRQLNNLGTHQPPRLTQPSTLCTIVLSFRAA